MADVYGDILSYGQLPYKQIIDGRIYTSNKGNGVSGKCLRYAVNSAQGQGWCFYQNGDNMVWPTQHSEPMDLILDNEQVIKLAIDELDGQTYEIQTRNGPVGSGLTRSYRDKQSDYGGAEIPTRIKFPEHIAEEEHMELEHQESHFYLRPQDEDDKGIAGYDDQGFRDAQEIDIYLYTNGEQSDESAKTVDIPNPADVVYDRKVQDPRLQTEFRTAASSYQMVKTNQYYVQKDKRGSVAERTMSEARFQDEFALPEVWLSRNARPLLNLATGILFTGSYQSLVTGADGKTESALRFGITDGLLGNVSSLSGDFSITFNVARITVTTDILEFVLAGVKVGIVVTGSNYQLRFDNNGTIYLQDITWAGDWQELKVERDGATLRFGQNGQHIGVEALNSVIPLDGALRIMDSAIGDFHDLRVVPNTTSAEAFEYLNYDLTDNEGDATLPLW